MSAEDLLSRLEGVKPTGPGRWIARCAAHEDKHPSLSVRELADGRTLVHCFAGCSAIEVLNAAGLEFDVLFPEKRPEHGNPAVPRIPAADVLLALRDEAMLVATAAANLAQGVALTDEDLKRLWTAAGRIDAARSLANGRR